MSKCHINTGTGVVIDPKGSGHIVKLLLNNMDLQGPLPPSISELHGLEMVLLTDNTGLTGNIEILPFWEIQTLPWPSVTVHPWSLYYFSDF